MTLRPLSQATTLIIHRLHFPTALIRTMCGWSLGTFSPQIKYPLLLSWLSFYLLFYYSLLPPSLFVVLVMQPSQFKLIKTEPLAVESIKLHFKFMQSQLIIWDLRLPRRWLLTVVFWVISPCSSERTRPFGGAYHPHYHGRWICQARTLIFSSFFRECRPDRPEQK